MNNVLSNIYDKWIKTHGEGSRIGIIDSGFDINNIYLKDKISKYLDYGSSDIDHGTHVFGIMALNTNISEVVKGFADKAQYYIASVKMGDKNCMNNICKALQEMKGFKLDVINMSFTNYTESNKMKQLLYQLNLNGTILVGAYSDQLLYPHSYPYVISAGKQLVTENTFQSSISNNKFKYISGTSMQCAYISSVIAIARAYDKKINKNYFIELVSGNTFYKVQDNNKQKTNIDIRKTQYSLKLR